jgi:hypothetical protein
VFSAFAADRTTSHGFVAGRGGPRAALEGWLYLVRAYRAVRKIAEARGMSFREAAWLIAIERVAPAEALRGAMLTRKDRKQ